jgi:hypothetical protein
MVYAVVVSSVFACTHKFVVYMHSTLFPLMHSPSLQVSLLTSALTFLLGFFTFLDSDDPYITSGVKVALSVLALVANVAFVMYIAYLLLRRQEGKVQDAPATGDSPVTQAHMDDSDAVTHILQDLVSKGGTVQAPTESPEKRGPTLLFTARETTKRLSFDEGTQVLVERDDGTTYTAMTTAKSFTRRMVSVMDNEDPSEAVDVLCARVRPLELKEQQHSPVDHEVVAVRAGDGVLKQVDIVSPSSDAKLDCGGGALDALGDVYSDVMTSLSADEQGKGHTL